MSLTTQNSQRYIFLADDDADDRELFSDALTEADPSAVLMEAEDGMKLMEIFSTIKDTVPDIVFLDINMPRKGGFECLEEIRKQKGRLQEIIIIMLSTSSDPEDIEKAMRLGASFYAVKPSCFDTLRTFVSEVLEMDWSTCSSKSFRMI